MSQQVKMIIQLYGKVKKDGEWFISYCPPLDVYSQGETRDKAESNLIEATALFLASCFERGVLDEVLKKCGFKAVEYHSAAKKQKIPSNTFKMDVPIPFTLPERKRAAACHT